MCVLLSGVEMLGFLIIIACEKSDSLYANEPPAKLEQASTEPTVAPTTIKTSVEPVDKNDGFESRTVYLRVGPCGPPGTEIGETTMEVKWEASLTCGLRCRYIDG